MTSPSIRLYVLRSTVPERTLIVRRGPSRQSAAFLWNRKTDDITLGQWLKARLYNDRCDISPDGKHWIYFAMGKGGKPYTVMARTPYFTALDYYPEADTWVGGGEFDDNMSYTLSTWGVEKYKSRKRSNFKIMEGRISPRHRRWLRRGWQHITDNVYEKHGERGWILKRDSRFGYSDQGPIDGLSHQLYRPSTDGKPLPYRLPGLDETASANWADFDKKVIEWAEGSRLWRARMMGDDAFTTPKLVHDFASYNFEDRKAPY